MPNTDNTIVNGDKKYNKLDSLIQKGLFGLVSLIATCVIAFGASILSELKEHGANLIKVSTQMEEVQRQQTVLFSNSKELRDTATHVDERITILEVKVDALHKP